MAKKTESDELDKFKDIFLEYLLKIAAPTQLIIEKGLITNTEFTAKLELVRQEFDHTATDYLL